MVPVDDDAPDTAPAAPDVSALVTDAVNKALGPVGQAFQNLSTRVETLASQRSAPQDDPTRAYGGATGTSSFLDNPDAFIDAKLAAFAKDRLAPLLQPVLDDKVEANMDSHRVSFDAEFGEGQFDKVVGPELDTIVKNLPPNQAVSNRHVRLALDALKGKHFDTLMDAKAAVKKTRADTPPPLLPNGRVAPSKPTLTAEELDFLSSAERATGKKVSKEEWIEERDLGNDEDSWRAHFASKQGKESGRGKGTIQ